MEPLVIPFESTAQRHLRISFGQKSHCDLLAWRDTGVSAHGINRRATQLAEFPRTQKSTRGVVLCCG